MTSYRLCSACERRKILEGHDLCWECVQQLEDDLSDLLDSPGGTA